MPYKEVFFKISLNYFRLNPFLDKSELKQYVSLDGEDKEAEAVVWWQAWRQSDSHQLTSWKWIEKCR
jgi:hypothetical protein